MDASNLVLVGDMRLVCDGQMREARLFDVVEDKRHYRYDTVIDGRQQTYSTESAKATDALREEALRYFKGREHG